jgi:hypothetical protein
MPESSAGSDLSLAQFLSSRARRSSDGRLALDVACGFVVALAAVIWHGPGWRLITPAALCFLGYGAWGIADRELLERIGAGPRSLTLLRVARLAAAIVGIVAAVTLVLTGMAVALGTIQS